MNVHVNLEGMIPEIASVSDRASSARAALQNLREIEIEFDDGIAWSWMRPLGRPSATPSLITDCHAWVDNLSVLADTGEIRFGVLGSRFPNVWNLGGDLNLFAQLIRAQDLDALIRYGKHCVSWNATLRKASDHGLVTVALVQGSAMGGGFEAARMCDLLVAEKSAKFALPEALFNLFPGMGAVSQLMRRVGPRRTREMLLDGSNFDAQSMYDVGMVDFLVEDGEGPDAVRELARKYRRRHSALASISGAIRDAGQTQDELDQIVTFWAERAIRTEEPDLRIMERIVRSQDSKLMGVQAAA